MPPALNSQEIAALLRRAAKGEARVRLLGPSWDEVYAGNVEFEIDGYHVVVFNDCDELDYVDRARSPDGRAGTFAQWWAEGPDPVDLLTVEECKAVHGVLQQASH